MSSYLFPISTAALVFPLIALGLTLPYALYSYRRYGAVSVLRSVIFFSFLFYLQCAYYLTILPLPDPQEVDTWVGKGYQFIPFYFVYDAISHATFDLASPSAWLSFLTSSYIYEPLCNVALTLPFGIYLSYYFKRSLKTVFILSFALAFFFELSQFTGLFGVYSRPYRIADVDDLILNTLGGVLGYFVYTRFLRFLPSTDRMDQASARRSVSVGYVRRFVALLVDSAIVGLISWLIVMLTGEKVIFDGGGVGNNYVTLAVLFLYYPLIALLMRGATPGKAIVRIRIEAVKGSGPAWLLIVLRYVLRNALIVLFGLSNQLAGLGGSGGGGLLQNIIFYAGLLAGAFLLLDFLLSLRSKRGKRLWYE
ncbi:MAG: VanZ family protein, partial [Coriobacteriales bacterium]|nr:VanZ family protein [Coriobacteriales bacterium]